MRNFSNRAFISASNNGKGFVRRLAEVFKCKRGEGFVDSAVKILMAVVIGALVLSGLYLLFKDNILPNLTNRINEMFNFKG